MSSILDALKKLEEEEAQAADSEELDLDPQAAAKDLVGQGLGRERLSFRLSPGVALMGIAFFAVVLVGASTAITVMILRPGAPPPAPEPGQAQQIASAAIPTSPAQTAVQPTTQASTTEPVPISTEATVPKAIPALETSRQPQGIPIAGPARADSPNAAPGGKITAEKDVMKIAALVPPVAQSVSTVPAKVEVAPSPPPSPTLREESRSRSAEAEAHPPRQKEPEASIRETDPPIANSVQPDRSSAPSNDPKTQIPSASPMVVAKNNEPQARPPLPREAVEPSFPESRSSSLRARETPSRVARDTARGASRAEAPGKRQWPSSIRNLPALSHTLRARHGLGSLRVQMVSPASDTRPYASAVINRMKIYLGERILNTRAKLVAIESSGVAIEITDTGERYFIRF